MRGGTVLLVDDDEAVQETTAATTSVGEHAVIRKPFGEGELAQRVAGMLAERRGGATRQCFERCLRKWRASCQV